jgi:hypothetical protein
LIILKDVPLTFNIDEALAVGGMSRVSDKIRNLSALLEECTGLVRPAAAYAYVKIKEISDGEIFVEDGKMLSSRKLAEQLKCATEIAPFVTTIGPDLERRVTSIAQSRLLDSWVLDNLGTYALRLLNRHLEEKIAAEKDWKISKFNPGSTPSWELEQQEVLFSIFSKDKIRDALGVILNDKFVMMPRKSISGIMAQTVEEYHNCYECPKLCEYRQKPYAHVT